MVEHFHLRRDDTGEVYTRKCDIHFLEVRKIGDGPVDIGDQFKCVSKLDGSEYTETLVAVGKNGTASTTRTWILRSDAMGINPDQRLEAMQADEALGCKIEYDEAGRAVFRSPGQYKRYAEAHGFFDKNAGYSGPKRRSAEERERMGLPEQRFPVEAYQDMML